MSAMPVIKPRQNQSQPRSFPQCISQSRLHCLRHINYVWHDTRQPPTDFVISFTRVHIIAHSWLPCLSAIIAICEYGYTQSLINLISSELPSYSVGWLCLEESWVRISQVNSCAQGVAAFCANVRECYSGRCVLAVLDSVRLIPTV